MGLRSVITITTSPAGGGKSYIRCARHLVDDYLVHTDGRHISNFPIGEVPAHHPFPPTFEGERFIDRIAQAVAKKRKCSAEEVAARLEIIPQYELDRWITGESGPWDWFADSDLTNCHVAIDEIHVYCGRMAKKEIRDKWMKWLGEIRHRGATIELISQNEEKIARELVNEAGAKIQIVKKDDEREPFFGILMGDWYELRAKFLTGKYTSCVAEIELRDVAGKWKENRVRRWWMTPDYFQYYDSHNAPHSGNGAGTGSPPKEFERRSMFGLVRWFVVRNFESLFWRIGMACVVVWGLNGGLQYGVGYLMSATKSFAKKNTKQADELRPHLVDGELHQVATAAPGTPPGGGRSTPNFKRRDADAGTPEARERNEAQERIELLERQMRQGFAIGLMTENEVTLRSGYTYRVNEVIDAGPHKGRRLMMIDWTRRIASLDDGTILRMGVALDAGKPERLPLGDVDETATMARRPTGTDLR